MQPVQRPGEQDPRSRPARPGAVILSGLVALSLVLNVVLSERLSRQTDKVESLTALVEKQDEDLSALRERIRGAGGSDPLGRVAAAVEALRKLEFKRTATPELLSASALSDRVRKLYTRDVDKADMDITDDVLTLLGVLPPDLDLYATLQRLQQEQVAGYYDSKTKRLVVSAADAKDPSPLARFFIAHEYVHALTDQYFDLGRLDALDRKDADDEASAFQALIEGDATYVTNLYASQILNSEELTRAQEEINEASSATFDAAPAFLRSTLQMPYRAGLAFVEALQRSGGVDAVDNAYRDPPTSTEQILHPAKYISAIRDEPRAVTVPNVARVLGGAWRSIDKGGFGEFDLREVLDLGGGVGLGASDAREAAAGWDGGRYVALRAGTKVVVAMLTAWDSPTEATESARLMARWLPLRFKNEGKAFDPDGIADGWEARSGAGLVARAGDRVVLIMGPDRATVERARRAFTGI